MSKFVGFGCDGASNMMGCKTGLVIRLQECYPEVEEIASDRKVEIESEKEIQSNSRVHEIACGFDGPSEKNVSPH